MIKVARQADLSLPEYKAFREGQSLPRMRCWELPFALFHARLSDRATVLDCTINPVNFQERLTSLYRHAQYHHWRPIQDGQFVLPLGMPDASFDRVICVNTLEHLFRWQREALIGAMACKLKPGGLLILTSDFYFERLWEESLLLQAGLVRSDREEVFNGFNKVTPEEWIEVCSRHALHPLTETVETPREDDLTLFRHEEPYAHACIGGVFFKAPSPVLPAGKKIVLALLTWNTCAVSMESVQCYQEEARLLRRLGHEAHLCVCDNGSTDGTPEALREQAAKMDLPCTLILNEQNLGSSIARNQIIDLMLAVGADYLLFMDGDIEVVPFSSVSMLRYMEDMGQRLGCIGPYFESQTPNRGEQSTSWYTIDPSDVRTVNHLAWTQYGLFRRALFEEGVRFDETEPFDRVGWGYEDNDLAFQMEMKGYLNQCFFSMIYLHRAAGSSIRTMHALGIDPHALYLKRKQYLIDKWSSVSAIQEGPMGYVVGQSNE